MRNRPPVQLAATAVAAAFVLVAVLGVVPGITTDDSELSFAGARSFLVGGGIVYLVLTVYASVIEPTATAASCPSTSPTTSSTSCSASR